MSGTPSTGRLRLEAWGAAFVTALAARAPRKAALAFGRGLGRFWGDLDRRHTAIAADNLRRAFPDWDASRVRRTASDVYAHFGQVLLDVLWMSSRPPQRAPELVESIEGREHVERALAEGRGFVIATAHLGNWELHGLVHGLVFGSIGVVARPLDNPALDARLVASRAAGGNQVIYKQRALQQVLRLLRGGRGVAILLDQNTAEGQGVFVDFFGRPASTTTVVAALAAKTGCAIVPAWSRLLPDGRYRLVYRPALRFEPDGDREQGIARLTQRITAVLEDAIREAPEQWLWIHRRWKTQPPAAEPAGAGAP
jgi:KDO2-lipid IV(A) lauroyltransferase